MFTGLIAAIGTIGAVDPLPEGRRLVLNSELATDLSEGDSIAVDGVCLTATKVGQNEVAADVMHETLRRSRLGLLAAGEEVNLELALRSSDRLGGHLVQGHVDGVGTVTALRSEGIARVVTITAEAHLLRFIAEKGSVAIDGVSLTVTRAGQVDFEVSLIPETLRRTTLDARRVGSTVNIEVDLVARYLARLADASSIVRGP